MVESNQQGFLNKLRNSKHNVTSFYADVIYLKQLSQADDDNNTVSRLYGNQLTDPTAENDQFQANTRLKATLTYT